MDFAFLSKQLPSLLQGSIMTVELTVISLLFGSLLGIILALFKVSKVKPLYYFAVFYTWIFRGTPLMLQLFFFYAGLPFVGITLSPFLAASIGLSLNCGAYMGEIIRGGINAIDKGQFEASKALGFSYFATMSKIILPQTLRVIIPPVGNEFISMLKDTSIVATIAMEELMRKSQMIISSTYKFIDIFVFTALMYLFLTTIFSAAFSLLEKKLSKYA